MSPDRIDKTVFSIISSCTGVFDELQFVKSNAILLPPDGLITRHKVGQVAIYYNKCKRAGKLIFAESRWTLRFRENIKKGGVGPAELHYRSAVWVVDLQTGYGTKYSFSFCSDRLRARQFAEAINTIFYAGKFKKHVSLHSI